MFHPTETKQLTRTHACTHARTQSYNKTQQNLQFFILQLILVGCYYTLTFTGFHITNSNYITIDQI